MAILIEAGLWSLRGTLFPPASSYLGNLSRTVVVPPVNCKRIMRCGSSFVSHCQILCFIICRWYLLMRLIRHPSPAARAFQSSLEQHSTPSCLCFPNATPFPLPVPLINASNYHMSNASPMPLCASWSVLRVLKYGMMADLPFELAVTLVEQPFLSVGVEDTILQGALPLVLHPLHLVIRAEDGVAVVVVIVVNLVGVVFGVV
jgi:hypothetical protein